MRFSKFTIFHVSETLTNLWQVNIRLLLRNFITAEHMQFNKVPAQAQTSAMKTFLLAICGCYGRKKRKLSFSVICIIKESMWQSKEQMKSFLSQFANSLQAQAQVNFSLLNATLQVVHSV